jgi:hypothetical protein
MQRQSQPDKIINPAVTGHHATMNGAKDAIKFYSNKYNELNCAEFYQ